MRLAVMDELKVELMLLPSVMLEDSGLEEEGGGRRPNADLAANRFLFLSCDDIVWWEIISLLCLFANYCRAAVDSLMFLLLLLSLSKEDHGKRILLRLWEKGLLGIRAPIFIIHDIKSFR